MKKWLKKIDFILMFRLCLSAAMLITGYIQNDTVSAIFGLILAVYAIVGAKYKVGCGYNACGYQPGYTSKYAPKKVAADDIQFTEIK